MEFSTPFAMMFIFLLFHDASATENGIVGFGISLYQDLCCQSCHDSLSSLYLSCTTFSENDEMSGDDMTMEMDTDMAIMGVTSDECYATNKQWLETMAYCIQQNCNADGYPEEEQAKCFSTQAVAGASDPTFQNSLPAVAPTAELSSDAMWLNETSLVNAELYYETHGTLGEFARSEYIHTRYSVTLYLVIIGTCIACGAITQTTSALPKFRKVLQASNVWTKLRQHIFLPALFGSRRLEPLPGYIGYVPGRTLSIFIGIYIILNVVFSSVNFQSFQPNLYFASRGFELCEYVGNRTGTVSLVNMSIAILFAGRNNILIALTGWTQTSFLTLHRWAARIATVQAVVHSIVYTLAYFEPDGGGAAAYAAKAAEPFFYWGIIATIALCLLIGLAILPIRIRFYEFFLVTHIILVILTLVACWYHLVPHFGLIYGYQVWLYIAFAFWSFDRLARLIRIVYYNRLGNSTATVEVIPNCNIIQLTVFPRTWEFGPGQHSFLYFPGLGKFWENHPFSVAGWNKQGQASVVSTTCSSFSSDNKNRVTVENSSVQSIGTESQPTATVDRERAMFMRQTQTRDQTSIKFLVRAHSGMTSTILQHMASRPSGSSMELSVYTEGPHAGHRVALQPLLLADTVLCLAGGIGITNALGFIQEYASVSTREGESVGKTRGIMKHTKRFILAWSAREAALIDHVKRNFLASIEGIEFCFWCTDECSTDKPTLDSPNLEDPKGSVTPNSTGTTAGRMDIEAVIRSSVEVGHQTAVLVCGPGGMADEATKQVISCVKDGFQVDMIEEAYTW